PPLEELTPRRRDRVEPPRRWPCYLGLGLVGFALAVTVGLINGWYPPGVDAALLPPLMAGLLIGRVLALPLLLRPLPPPTGRLLRALRGTEGRLAFRDLERHPGRTALTVGVLFIAVVVAVAFGQTLKNTVRDIDTWFRRTLLADFLVRGVMPDPGLLAPSAIPEDLGDRLAALDGREHG